jgi:hypothetical protein
MTKGEGNASKRGQLPDLGRFSAKLNAKKPKKPRKGKRFTEEVVIACTGTFDVC